MPRVKGDRRKASAQHNTASASDAEAQAVAFCSPLLHLIAARHLPNRSGTGADPVQAAHYRRNAAWAGCLGSNLDYRVRFESGAAANTPALMRWRFDDWLPFNEWGYAARKDACRAPPHECGGVESRHATVGVA